ncbi:thioredoxin domain-containing protein [Chlamydiales bacterium]|nr:thioredoxin domain-containing protein [Chlamydiales bacterium]
MPKKFTNRLIHEKSPYLLQHAHNPVDWYSWGDEAFSAAKESDKPIFLSIGYATCHWCHVMEKESFTDPELAEYLNETFINVKIDREEHPEVDSLYMEFAQGMMAGTAGWPLNVVLTADLHPVFAATYLPPTNRQGIMGLRDLAKHFQEVWRDKEEREKLSQQAEKIVEVYRESQIEEKGVFPSQEVITEAADIFFKIADPIYGGLKGSPKFPLAYQLNFLLNFSKIKQDSRSFFLVEKSLDMMHRGGIFDHIGGGFSRYCVDDKWMIPHFEKMLYDNAIILESYLLGYLVEKKPLYKEVCTEIVNYILREMCSEEGGFYSAEDADSEGQEGLFYTWTPEEIRELLPQDDADLISLYYDITPIGNFEGRSVVNTPESIDQFCLKYGVELELFKDVLEESKKILFQEREKRIHPFKDDKVLTSWNGLMIHSLVQAGISLNKPLWIEKAILSAHFIINHLWNGEILLHRSREGDSSINGGLDDYAFFIKALISLFEVTGEKNYLEWAFSLSAILEDQFEMSNGGFHQTDGDDPYLIIRKAQYADGAEPSGNGIHCENLLRLHQITHNERWLKSAEGIFKAVNSQLGAYSPGYTFHIMNLLRFYDQKAPTFILAEGDDEHLEVILKAIYHQFIPHKSVIVIKQDSQLKEILPYLEEYSPLENQTTMYLCYQKSCKEPLNDVNKILETIAAC